MRKALLTIDDSPSERMDDLTDFLCAMSIPAIFFCRGDLLAKNQTPVVRAIEKGFIIANHAYGHRRAGALSCEENVEEIEKTESLVESAYRAAGRPRPAKYFRFPQMDRGCGGWVVDYDAVPAHRETLVSLFAEGLNLDLVPPTDEQKHKKQRLQDYLRREGYAPLPSSGITHPWFAQTEMAHAVDAMFTYSTADWMLTTRHKGKWLYKTLDGLKRKIDADPWLKRGDSAHIILAHDQAEIFDVSTALISYLQETGFMYNIAHSQF